MTSPLLLGVRDAARELGIGRDRCYELVKQNRIRHVALGRRVLIPRAELDAFVQRETEGGDAYDSREQGTAGSRPEGT